MQFFSNVSRQFSSYLGQFSEARELVMKNTIL